MLQHTAPVISHVKKLSCLALCLAALTLAGCDSATSRQPVGDKVAKLDKAELDGVWEAFGPDKPEDKDPDEQKTKLSIRVKDAALGIISFAELKDGGAPEYQDVMLRETPVGMVGNLKRPKDPEYDFVRVLKYGGDHLLVYLPDIRFIQGLVKRGDIKGVIDDGSVLIDGLRGQDFVWLKQKGINPEHLFESSPLLMHRVASH